jgi:hypothetical protein
MNRFLVVGVLALAATAHAAAQSHENCPKAPPEDRRAGVDHRHDDATGVPHAATEHHFLLTRDGGSIRLEAKDASQVEARDAIRRHLRAVAGSFASGDFSVPMLIHDQIPPGALAMKERKAAIRYAYSPSDKGGVIRISSRDAAAIDAVHEFLRFQIRDHGTGDPTE